jgi:MoxR-like ATPase
MQEKQVTVSGQTRPLEEPFIVFATQNPIEHEGTYPLPEAQLDRFFFLLKIDYPDLDEERDVVLRTTARGGVEPRAVLDAAGVLALQDAALDMPLPRHVLDKTLLLVRASRPDDTAADEYIRNFVAWGAGPRASQNLVRAAKALALLRGQPAVSIEEARDVAPAILRHRIIPNYTATGEGIAAEQIVGHLLERFL